MSLREALEKLVVSEPFERLLLARARPIVARAEAGQDFVIAGVAAALEGTVMAVTAGPREADALAADVAAFLGPERVALLPAWEALPYEQISPSPEVAARRADAVHRLREARGPFVRRDARARGDAGRDPHTRHGASLCSSWPGARSRPTTWPNAS